MTGPGARIGAAATFALLLAGCGGAAEQGAQAPVAVEAPAAVVPARDTTTDTAAVTDAASSAALPDVEVVRVTKGGEKVNLQSLHVAGKPTLLWFWAPHCPICKAEAPKLLDFNAKHGTTIAVLGLGAQDSLEQAGGFTQETSTTPLEMVWDSSGKSWVHYRVTNQPTVILLDGEGKVVKRWFRNFDEQGILEAAGQG